VHWVVENGHSFVATTSIYPGIFGKPHNIELVVHPDWRSYLEKSLIGRALNYLYQWRNAGVMLKHPADHGEAISVYKSFGFEEEQTFLWMKQEL
jgi:hypothetical protein